MVVTGAGLPNTQGDRAIVASIDSSSQVTVNIENGWNGTGTNPGTILSGTLPNQTYTFTDVGIQHTILGTNEVSNNLAVAGQTLQLNSGDWNVATTNLVYGSGRNADTVFYGADATDTTGHGAGVEVGARAHATKAAKGILWTRALQAATWTSSNGTDTQITIGASSSSTTTITGTLAASNSNCSFLAKPTTTTDPCYIEFANGTSSSITGFVGNEGSTGSSIIYGTSAYDLSIAPGSGKNLQLGYNNGTGRAVTIDSSGNTTIQKNLNVGNTTTSVGGAWTTYSSSISAGSGTGLVASASGSYQQLGKIVHFRIVGTITTNGSAGTYIIMTLPVQAASSFVAAGREISNSGFMLQGLGAASSSNLTIFNYDNTYPGSSGATLVISGIYEST